MRFELFFSCIIFFFSFFYAHDGFLPIICLVNPFSNV